ncbi:hypothetical protein M8R20_20755 [Pseudomonas sp. R2.Fl]|nr:hypothetical protein [Pseudomonas sp. R2.Fl]
MHAACLSGVAVGAVLLALPAHAADQCGRWTAEIWEVEGGEAMTASICLPGAVERRPVLYFHCWQPGSMVLNYDDGGTDQPPGDNYDYTGTFIFASGGRKVEKELIYSAMDAVMTADLADTDPLLAILRGDGEVTITPPTPDFAANTFPLAGAAEAFDTLAKACNLATE